MSPELLNALAGWPTLLAIFVACIVASCFFSFSETCLTSVSEGKAHAIVASGGRHASVLRLWIDEPQRVLTTILIGNNIANNLAAVLMAELTRIALGQVAIAWASGSMTLLILVFGEITPKTLARQHAQRAAVPVLLVLRLFNSVLAPVAWIFLHIASVAVKLAGGDLRGGRDTTEAEIQALIDLARREGVLGIGKAGYLRAVFELGERQVRAIMVARPDVESLDIDLPPEELVRRVDASGHSRIPVFRASIDNVLGILHVKDVLHLLSTQGAVGRRELQRLLRQPVFVPETMRLDTLLSFFRRSRQHLVVVLDEFGGMAGIVTLEDVLEELVGEIRDEHDPDEDEPTLVPSGPRRWTAPGRLPLSELERVLGVETPRDPGYETLAGLLMDLTGEVPREGTEVLHQGWAFEILTGDEKRVGLVRIHQAERGETGG